MRHGQMIPPVPPTRYDTPEAFAARDEREHRRKVESELKRIGDLLERLVAAMVPGSEGGAGE